MGSALPESGRDRAFDIAASLDALEQSDREASGGRALEEPEQHAGAEEVWLLHRSVSMYDSHRIDPAERWV